jgi:DHA1 family multidrug resistance protein-like MFS transporter
MLWKRATKKKDNRGILLLMEPGKHKAASAYASLALSFAGFGDTFLYPFLPLNSLQVGIPVFWVGLILSANRFVRILLNSTIVNLVALYGMRTVTIVAVVVAIFSTAGYAMASGLFTWFMCRMVWGLCYSALRITSIGYALDHPRQGLALGISRSIQEIGAVVILTIAPLMLQYVSAKMVFVLIALVSLPAVYFAWNLPVTYDRPPKQKTNVILQFPSSFNSITFASTFVIDGIVVLSLGILFLKYANAITPLVATALAAGYLAYRRICSISLSMAGGWIADKIGIDRAFNISMFFVIAGLSLLIVGWISVGVVIIFTFFSINSMLTPGSISKRHDNVLAAVSENATWRDIGAAAGALAGGFLLTSPYLHNVLSFGTLVLIILFLVHIGSAQRLRKFFYL